MKDIVNKLIESKKTISTMESCTGGMFANEITNIPNASQIFKFSAVTYSNEFKIKMNVSSELINKYSVYSMEVAMDMSYQISEFTNSDYGIGITGKLMKSDENNPFGNDNIVYYAIYEKETNKYYTDKVIVNSNDRIINKRVVIEEIIKNLKTILK